jgi:hypothetical protein
MANLPAVAADGATIVYLKSFGAGTDLDPYVPGNALIDDDGNAFSSLLAGSKRTLTVALVDDNGDQILNFGGDASAANQTAGNTILSAINSKLAGTLAATQSGVWTVAISNFPTTQPISASSLPLPNGAATAANQATIIGHIDGIETLLGGSVTVNTGLTPLTDTQLRATPVPVSGTFWQATQPVSADSLPLPTGAATAANQTTIIGYIDSIETLLSGTLTVSTGLSPLTDAQLRATAVPASVATLPSVTLSSESGFLTYRNTALTNTAVAVKAVPGSVMGWNFINSNTVPVYVKFYNTAAASVTVGTTAVVLTIAVPPASTSSPGIFFLEPGLIPVEVFSTAIAMACVTGLADNNNTAPSTAIHASVRYK